MLMVRSLMLQVLSPARWSAICTAGVSCPLQLLKGRALDFMLLCLGLPCELAAVQRRRALRKCCMGKDSRARCSRRGSSCR